MLVLPAAPAIVFFSSAAAGRLLSANAKGRVFPASKAAGRGCVNPLLLDISETETHPGGAWVVD
jgi:hypothetical protein